MNNNKNMKNSNEMQNQKLDTSNVIDVNYQEKLFHEINNMKNNILNLAGLVQNDFNRLLDDGTITKEEIKNGIHDMDNSFNETINELNSLREKCRTLMSHYSE